MPQDTSAGESRAKLLRAREGLMLCQSIYAAAQLNLADHVSAGVCAIPELAEKTGTNAAALQRLLRLLASEQIFRETAPGEFQHTDASELLCSDAAGSLRPLFLFIGSDFFYPCFGQIGYSVETGVPSRTKLSGTDSFTYLSEHPGLARVFDDAMTAMVEALGPAIARAYDFGQWGRLMDVGGGNGILLAHILRAYPMLQGVLADQEHVLMRAREKGFLAGDLQSRADMAPCNFFREIPQGSRAYLMSRVIHDWNDEQAKVILDNCRHVIPPDGALLLVENALGDINEPSPGRYADIAMLVLTGGRERTVDEYRALLAASGFRLQRAVPTRQNHLILEAFPA
jgi:hypothetical protein